MFCQKCGKQIDDNSNFCVYCGARVNNIEPENPILKTDKNNSSIYQVKNLLNYFSRKSDTYNKYDQITAMIYKFSKGRTKILKSISYGCLALAGLLLLIFVISVISNSNYSNFSLVSTSIMLLIYCVIIFIGPGIVLMIVDRSLNNKFQRNLDLYLNRYLELSNELYLNYINYENCPIKAEYTNPNNIFMIKRMLLSGQADTINEAITILSNSMNCTELNNYTKSVAEFAKKIAEENERLETASTLSTVFLPGNYFYTNSK